MMLDIVEATVDPLEQFHVETSLAHARCYAYSELFAIALCIQGPVVLASERLGIEFV